MSSAVADAADSSKQALAVPGPGIVSAKRSAELFGSAAALQNLDFNGDGKADLLWANGVTGEAIAWLMNGNVLAGGGQLLRDPNFKIIGSGDFNGDGKSDIVWYNATTRQTVIWLMNGNAVIGGGALPNSPAFSIVGAPDLNGDGKSDLVWYNPTDGHTYAWLMNGVAVIGEGTLLIDAKFKVVAFPDLNGDSKSDLVWYNDATGQSIAWLMNGVTLIGGGPLLTHPTFRVVGTPDLNGDGKSDLLWSSPSTGENIGWLMNGNTLTGGGPLLTNTSYKIVGTPDLNGDGKADLLWYNASTGETVAWLMNGAALTGGGQLLKDTKFSVVGTSDLNGDGKSDLQWLNASEGKTLTWLMNGMALVGGGELLTDPNFRLAGITVNLPVVTARTVGGTVTGLTGSGLVLRSRCPPALTCTNSSQDLSVSANGGFTFNGFVDGNTYTVSVLAQPSAPEQVCTVSNGSGLVAANVSNISVNCVSPPRFNLGGVVSGLTGSGLVLQNGSEILSVDRNGVFTFITTVASGNAYNVTVRNQPSAPTQTCSVSSGTGNAQANVTAVTVSCSLAQRLNISGTVSGLEGKGLVLQNNNGDNLTVNSNGSFTFATSIIAGANYNVAVLTQPTPAQQCTVSKGIGTVAAANISDITVTCPAIPKTPTITTSKNVFKLKYLGGTASMAVAVANGPAGVGFTWTSPQRCAGIAATSNSISVTPRAAASFECREDLVITYAGVSKTVTINVYNPTSMDVGEGLIITYAHKDYANMWDDSGSGGSEAAIFWHYNQPQTGYFPLGSHVQGNYEDINTKLSVPMILVRDTSAAQNLLANPVNYTQIWNDSGSGANRDGTVWRANCPTGYVALGSVFWNGGAPPLNAIKCVARRFTTPGTKGTRSYADAGTGANFNISAWSIGQPIAAPPDGKAALWTRSYVGCGGDYDGNGCVLSDFNLLLIPLPVAESNDDTSTPVLTSCAPLQVTSNRSASSVRVPFTMLPALDPQCGTDLCKTAGAAVASNASTSPFYYLQRVDRFSSEFFNDYRQATVQQDIGKILITTGWEKSEEETLSVTVGFTVSAGSDASFYKASLSAQFGWSRTNSSSYSYSKAKEFGPYTADPGTCVQIVAVETVLDAISEQGAEVKKADGKSADGVTYLRFPVAGR